MPKPPRHYFDPDNESTGAMAPLTFDQTGALSRPVPTPETQVLYNRWREEEERLTPESLQQVPEGTSEFLQLPSPSTGRASSPSRSHGSTAPSISQAMSGMHLDRAQSPVKKAASGRHGPLPKKKKLKAALMRKLKACDDCRKRKVECNHLDLSLFEAAYQVTHPTKAQLPDPPYRSPLGDPIDLLGVGASQNFASYPAPLIQAARTPGGTNEALLDHDLILEPAGHQYPPVPPHLANPLAIVESIAQHRLATTPQNVSMAQYQADPAPESVRSAIGMPIGKQVPSNGQWDCSWGSEECGSSVSSGGLPCCRQRCMTLEELKVHFQSSHAPFHGDWAMWRCTYCQLDDAKPTGCCPQCSNPYWQRWHWANVGVILRQTSRLVGRITAEDGSPSNRSSWTSQSAYFSRPGHSGSHTSSWAYGYGNASGQPSWTAQAAAAWRDPEQHGPCCEKSPLSDCRSVNPLGKDVWWSLIHDAPRTALITHACPAFVLLAVFLIVMIDDWLPSGTFGGWLKQMMVAALASDIIQDAGSRVPEVSIACIATGLFASWLVRHVMFRLNQHEKAEGLERCLMRDIFHISPADRDQSVAVTAD